MKAVNLRTEHMTNPMGIDIIQPILSWNDVEGVTQSAYEITAYSSSRVIWTSGKITGSEMQSPYQGPANSRERICWTVKLWDEQGVEGPVSREAFFEYAFLTKEEWKAKWINPEVETENTDGSKEPARQPASVLRRTFTVSGMDNARIYASAHGIYVMYINGQKVTEQVLAPGTSEYWFRMPYQVYDVSSYLQTGENRIEVVLGDGWYRGCNGNTGEEYVFGKDIAFLMQMEIQKEIVLVTDSQWEASQNNSIVRNDIQLGEIVDARIETKDFHAVKVEDIGYDQLICTNAVPIVEKETFKAKLITTPKGEKVLDFGQNMAGYVSFAISGHEGQKLVMTHGEYLDTQGNFSDENLKTIGRKTKELHQVVEYTCREGDNVYCPSLCIFGFQMVKIETDIPITGEEFTAHAVYSDINQTATFSSDQPLLDKLFMNTVWSQKSNFVDVPTDCPQRERSRWAGDAGVFADAGITLMDGYSVFRRWLGEMRVDQYVDGKVFNFAPRRSATKNRFDVAYDGSCGWGDAVIIIPYAMYQLYGDKRILEENYEMMSRWLGYCEKKAKKSRFKNRFKRNPYRKYTVDTGIHWGEWLEAGVSVADSTKEMLLHGVPDIATAYYASSSKLLSEIAEVLGKTEDAEHFAKLADMAGKAYRHIELKDGRIHSDRQCRYVRPLYMGLLNKKEAAEAAKDLNDHVVAGNYHLNTGFLTTPHLCEVLADYGYVDTAYRVLLQEDTPGWLFSVKKGATTIWESWEGYFGDIGFASLNHYSKGAVTAWMVEGIGGIHVSNRTITINPQPCSLLQQVKVTFDAPCGLIESAWHYQGDNVVYEVTIPSNTEAAFVMPNGDIQKLNAGQNRICV